MNKITELFSIQYPIVQGGMVWVSGWKLASAVSNAGGLGLIGAGSMYPDVLREHIQKYYHYYRYCRIFVYLMSIVLQSYSSYRTRYKAE